MKVIVQNLVTEYQDEGKGPVILMLHGWQQNLRSFDALASLFSDSHRIIRLDLPGFGNSELPDFTWDLDNYVRFVRDFVDKLNLKVKILIGHSFGGRVAIKGTAAKMLKPQRLVLIAPAWLAKNRTFKSIIFKWLAKIIGFVTYFPPLSFWREAWRKRFYKLIKSDYYQAGRLRETMIKILAEDLKQSAKKIFTPTLLIWGREDSVTPLKDGERLVETIPNSQLQVLEKASHFVHQERPTKVAQLIEKFT